MIRLLSALVFCALAGSQALAFQRGEWVLAQFQGGKYWFPGIVQTDARGLVTIRYDDGDVETRPGNQVRPYDWRVGSSVDCNWQRRGEWYAGRITALRGGTLSIAYNDGDSETTTTGMCRSR